MSHPPDTQFLSTDYFNNTEISHVPGDINNKNLLIAVASEKEDKHNRNTMEEAAIESCKCTPIVELGDIPPVDDHVRSCGHFTSPTFSNSYTRGGTATSLATLGRGGATASNYSSASSSFSGSGTLSSLNWNTSRIGGTDEKEAILSSINSTMEGLVKLRLMINGTR